MIKNLGGLSRSLRETYPSRVGDVGRFLREGSRKGNFKKSGILRGSVASCELLLTTR